MVTSSEKFTLIFYTGCIFEQISISLVIDWIALHGQNKTEMETPLNKIILVIVVFSNVFTVSFHNSVRSVI